MTPGWNNSGFIISYGITTGLVGLSPGVASPGMMPIATQPSSANFQADSASFTRTAPAVLDAAGRSSVSVVLGPFKLDSTPPTATCAVSATAGPNAAGWYRNPVTVTFSATDNLSGMDPLTPTSTTVLSSDGNPASTSIGPNFFKDVAGNGNTSTVACSAKIDQTKPTVTAALSGTPGTGGWLISAGTVTFNPLDATSGILNVHYNLTNAAGVVTSGNLTSPWTLNVTGVGRNTVTYSAVDNAGNQSDTGSIDVFINRTLTVTAVTDSKQYDGTAASSLTPTVVGLVNPDTGTFTQTFNSVSVGTGKRLNAAATLNPANTEHYTITFVASPPTGSITRRTIAASSVLVTVNNKVYNGTTAATVTGCSLAPGAVVAGETVTCSAAAATFADANAGTGKTVTATGITLGGASAANYALASTTATTTANIAAATTATALAASTTSAGTGQAVTFTATVTPAGAAGTVTFSDGATVLGSVTLAGNTASLQVPSLALGSHPITATFSPSTGNYLGSVSPTVTVVVSSNRLPVCTAAGASPASLWPPNHKFVAIAIKGVTDPDNDAVTIVVNRIWQDESTTADGSGDPSPDGMIVGGAAQVRAERAGSGDGRIYQIFFTATDTKSGSCSGSVTVGVPHDQSGGPLVDSGVRYDSLVSNGPPVAGTPPNRNPVATADSAVTLKGIATTIAVLANDSDPDGNTLTIASVTPPAHGTATINASGTITYTSVSGYAGSDSFTYTVSDGHGGTATATVSVTVKAHTDGDDCEHDQHRHGGHDNDDSDHDRDTRRR